MKRKIAFYTVNPSYCEYLRQFDPRVLINYNGKESRPFIGIVLKIENFNYYAPLTSPKPKHLSMKNSKDFIKIKDGLLGGINLNNMIPIHKSCLTMVDFKLYDSDSEAEIKQKKLMFKQWMWCNSNVDRIIKNSKNLYRTITTDTNGNNSLAARCCDFKLLEEKYLEYCKLNNLTIPQKSSLDQRIKKAEKLR